MDFSDDDDRDEETFVSAVCLVCQVGAVEYMPAGCRCAILCKKCAMKLATGGKCKRCKKFFGEVRRVPAQLLAAVATASAEM